MDLARKRMPGWQTPALSGRFCAPVSSDSWRRRISAAAGELESFRQITNYDFMVTPVKNGLRCQTRFELLTTITITITITITFKARSLVPERNEIRRRNRDSQG